MSKIVLLFILMAIHLESFSQVVNDSIQGRIQLQLDQPPFYSNTFHSTVEKNCINKNLTRKCLIYHNDQWFYFIAPQDGRFFLNFTSQHCRDSLGIQLVLIEGDPCQVATYKILQCISQLPQRDCYAVLDSLKKGTTYLINIDGFLGDYCAFDVQFASKPIGFPIVVPGKDTLDVHLASDRMVITMQWSISQQASQDIDAFKIYRSSATEKRTLAGTVEAGRMNALGDYTGDYLFTDTITHDAYYQYEIFEQTKETGEQILLARRFLWGVLPKPAKPVVKHDYTVSVPVSRDHPASVAVHILNRDNGELLWYGDVTVQPQKDSLQVDLTSYIKAGRTNFRVRLMEGPMAPPREYRFELDADDRLVRK